MMYWVFRFIRCKYTNEGSTSCQADECLWVQVPSGQSRSRQAGTESCGRRGNARFEVLTGAMRGAGTSLERWMFAEAECVP